MMPNLLLVTLADRVNAVGVAAMIAILVFAIGFVIHKAISKDSPNKRTQGRPVVWWVTILMFSGSCYGAWIADNQQYYLHEVVGGMGGFGLLAGLLIGNSHGFLNLYRARKLKSTASTASLHQSLPSDEICTENPYRSPRPL